MNSMNMIYKTLMKILFCGLGNVKEEKLEMRWDLNPRPKDYDSSTLTTELPCHSDAMFTLLNKMSSIFVLKKS